MNCSSWNSPSTVVLPYQNLNKSLTWCLLFINSEKDRCSALSRVMLVHFQVHSISIDHLSGLVIMSAPNILSSNTQSGQTKDFKILLS